MQSVERKRYHRVALAVFLSVAVVTGTFAPAVVVAASGNVWFDSISPSSDTTLSPGETYTFDITAGYSLSGYSSGEIRLYFESISSSAEDTATVSEGDGTAQLSASVTIPSDWDTSKDLQVTLQFVSSSGDSLDVQTEKYNVDSPNDPPTIDSYSPSDTAYEVTVGTSEDYSVSASDPDGDSLTYWWTVNDHDDDSGQYEVGSGTSHTHNWDTVGNYTIRAKVSDGTTTVEQSWTVVVSESATPPTVTTDSPSSIGTDGATLNGILDNTGSASSADVYFEYREDGTSTWQTTSTQTLSSSSGFSETVSLSPGTTYEYRAVATSPDGTDTGSIVQFSTDPEGNVWFDSITPSPGTELTPGETYSVDISAGYSLSSTSGGEIRLIFESISSSAEDVATVSSGSGTAPLSASLTVPSDWNTNDDLQITLQFVSGNGDSLDVQTEPYNVTSDNTPPSIDSYSPSDQAYEVTEGTTESYSVSASDADGDSLSYDWYVNDINDDTTDPQYVASGTDYTHTFDRTGDFSIRVKVNDGETTVEEVWTVSVVPEDTDSPPSLTRVSPGSSSLTVQPDVLTGFEVEASDVDEDLDRIEWSVDGETVHTRFLTGSSPATDAYNHSFASAGTYTLAATVYDGNGNSDAVQWSVTVDGDDGTTDGGTDDGTTDGGTDDGTSDGDTDDDSTVWISPLETTPLPGSSVSPGDLQLVELAVHHELPDGTPGTVELRVDGRSVASVGVSGSGEAEVGATVTVPEDGELAATAVLLVDGERVDAATATYPVGTDAAVLDAAVVSPTPPVAATAGEETTFSVTASAFDGRITRVAWRVNGTVVSERSVDLAGLVENFDRAFDEPGTYAVTAVVNGTGGASKTVTWRVEVAAAGDDRGSDGSDDGGSDDGSADVPHGPLVPDEGQIIVCHNACNGFLQRAVQMDDGTIVCIDWGGMIGPGPSDAIGFITPSVGPIGVPPVITVPYWEVDERECMF